MTMVPANAGSRRTALISVVLPLPRKPVTRSTGRRRRAGVWAMETDLFRDGAQRLLQSSQRAAVQHCVPGRAAGLGVERIAGVGLELGTHRILARRPLRTAEH